MSKEITGALAWGVGIVVLALATTLARKLGYLEQETVTRIVIGATGLMVAAFGNRIPKSVVPLVSARARRAQRVAGWSLVLSGMVYAGVFAFAPLSVAVVVGSGAIMLGIAVTFGYCLLQRAGTGAV